jgi:hypothetical protein
MVNPAEPGAAVGLAESFSVDNPVPEVGAKSFLLHEAEMPLGSPETAKAMFPVKEPPVAKVNASVALLPDATVTVDSADEKLRVGLLAQLDIVTLKTARNMRRATAFLMHAKSEIALEMKEQTQLDCAQRVPII